jgi:hypothetical protein
MKILQRRLRNGGIGLVACTGLACGMRGGRDPLNDVGPAPTQLERRVAGCYRLLGPVRGVAEEFSLLLRHGRGSGPEREGRLVRPRGSYNSSLWHQVSTDTLELIWTTAHSDSTRWEPGVVYWDALRARVALRGDSISGVSRWRTDYSSPDSFPFTAVRRSCEADAPH